MAIYRRFGMPIAHWPDVFLGRVDGLCTPYLNAFGRLLAYIAEVRGKCPVPSALSTTVVIEYLNWRSAHGLAATTLKGEVKALAYAVGHFLPNHDWSGLAALASVHKAKASTGRSRGRTRTLSLSPDLWPPEWRNAWERCFGSPDESNDDEFARVGCLVNITDSTRKQWEKSVGQYLVSQSPDLTPQGVQSFIRELRGRNLSSRTVATYVSALTDAVHGLGLPVPIWLRPTANRLEQQARTAPKKKDARPQLAPEQLWQLGERLILESLAGNPNRQDNAATYRDGLIILLLASLPLRASNLVGIHIGQNLILGEQFLLRFSAEETKMKKSTMFPLWPELQMLIQHYIGNVRPLLGRGYNGDELWLGASKVGGLGYPGLRRLFAAQTKIAFGVSFNLHYVRDVVATAIIEDVPERPDLASTMLYHRSSRSLIDYVQKASTTIASRRAWEVRNRVRANLHRASGVRNE